MTKKLTTLDFIEKAKLIHGNRYDYSKVDYVNSSTKVCIICHEKDENGVEHGEFYTTPNNHLRNRTCPKCNINNIKQKFLKSKEQFIKDAIKVHDDKYNYVNVDYNGSFKPIKIICPIHGEFEQLPHTHLNGHGCPKCGSLKIIETINKQRTSFNDFIERANKIHNNKYTYEQQEIINQHQKIKIICPIHGEFEQTINSHLVGCGCPKCSKNIKKDKTTFIEKSKIIHGDKYDYSKVEYNGVKEKVCIICPNHGEFWQIAEHHLNGCGCPICKESSMERELRLFLNENNIEYEIQKTFKWLGKQRLDFYLPQYNVAIECQGIQHFSFKENSKLFNKNTYEICVKRDNIKREKCDENGVKLLYYSNLGIEYPYHVFENKEELLVEIKKP